MKNLRVLLIAGLASVACTAPVALAASPALAAGSASAPPVVAVTSIVNALGGTARGLEVPFTINASASDPDGTVTRVEFYVGSTLVGADSTAPYQATVTNAGVAGTVTVTAKAFDNSGLSTTSAPVTVAVTPSKYTFRGVVTAGVEAGCLLLPQGTTTYLLIGGDRSTVLVPGNSVVVTGQVRPDLVTTCSQGVPLVVASAIKLR